MIDSRSSLILFYNFYHVAAVIRWVAATYGIAHRLPQIVHYAVVLTVDKSFLHSHHKRGLYL